MPRSIFCKKIIVCEGATEVGICRAMDKWRRKKGKPQMSFKDCAYVDGTGDTIVQRVDEISKSGLKTALLCDSDKPKINEKKSDWKENGISIFDCDDTLCLETQIFRDLPWEAIQELIDYVVKSHNKKEEDFKTSLKSKYANSSSFPENWKNSDTQEMREALAKASLVNNHNNKPWFKVLHHGEMLGNIIFKHFDDIDKDAHIKITLTELSNWIDI